MVFDIYSQYCDQNNKDKIKSSHLVKMMTDAGLVKESGSRPSSPSKVASASYAEGQDAW
jgi:hypothetical protein